MTDSSEATYLKIGALIEDMPDIGSIRGPVSHETNMWFARALVVIQRLGGGTDGSMLKIIQNRVGNSVDPRGDAQQVAAIMFRAFAHAEDHAPIGVRGRIILARKPYDAIMAVGETLERAKGYALIIDPFATHKVLDEFARLAPEGVEIRVLTRHRHGPGLLPSLKRWNEQVENRPAVIRTLPHDDLHDRFFVIDGKEIWQSGQSLNNIGVKLIASVSRLPPEVETMKLEAFAGLWDRATTPPGAEPDGANVAVNI